MSGVSVNEFFFVSDDVGGGEEFFLSCDECRELSEWWCERIFSVREFEFDRVEGLRSGRIWGVHMYIYIGCRSCVCGL